MELLGSAFSKVQGAHILVISFSIVIVAFTVDCTWTVPGRLDDGGARFRLACSLIYYDRQV